MRTLPNIELSIPELEKLYLASTSVVAWYGHPTQVRGPFCRWFQVSEVAPEYKKYVADAGDDAAYAAAAMNSVPHLIQRIKDLEQLLDQTMECVE